MKLHEGDHVKCFLRNATTIEGIVVEWSADCVVLKSIDEKTLLIAHHPGEDIMLTKIVLTEQSEPEPKKETHKPDQKPATSPKSDTRYVSTSATRELWKRSGGQCEYVDPVSGRRCQSSYKLQRDHLVAHAYGGSNSLDNLRLVCPTHNQLAAIKTFGVRKMKKYVPNII